jgi:hypothetical protein
MAHIIPEATPQDLGTIRAQVFLADTQDELAKRGVRNVTLKYKVEEKAGRGVAPSNYVELWKDGEHQTQCYIHPVHGCPKDVAYLLSLTYKPVALEGR